MSERELKVLLNDMVKKEEIQPSPCPWVAQIILVWKKDNSSYQL